LFSAALVCGSLMNIAGPPFVTDDPDPVENRHWEFYQALQHAKDVGKYHHLLLSAGRSFDGQHAFRRTLPTQPTFDLRK
jgi:hypothetical protein